MGTGNTLIVVLVMAMVAVLLLLSWRPRPKRLPTWPFLPRPLMTDAEVRFYEALSKAVPEYTIMVQVALSRIIDASHSDEPQMWFNRICRQSVDYVLVDNDYQTVLLAIELDDWTHDDPVRKAQDDKKDHALYSAGIPILRFAPQRKFSAKAIRKEVLVALDD